MGFHKDCHDFFHVTYEKLKKNTETLTSLIWSFSYMTRDYRYTHLLIVFFLISVNGNSILILSYVKVEVHESSENSIQICIILIIFICYSKYTVVDKVTARPSLKKVIIC